MLSSLKKFQNTRIVAVIVTIRGRRKNGYALFIENALDALKHALVRPDDPFERVVKQKHLCGVGTE